MPFEVIEVIVLRRSAWGAGACATDVETSLGVIAEALLESHEKGIVNFLGGGVAVGVLETLGLGGGGPQGTDGKLPERP